MNIKTDKTHRPPADRGQGRKSLDGSGKSPVLRLRVSQDLMDKVTAKTNWPQWARDVLMKAE